MKKRTYNKCDQEFPLDTQICLVEWVDAFGQEGWQNRDVKLAYLRHKAQRTVQTVGFLIEETPTEIYLTNSIDEDDIDFTLMIPRMNIQKLITL